MDGPVEKRPRVVPTVAPGLVLFLIAAFVGQQMWHAGGRTGLWGTNAAYARAIGGSDSALDFAEPWRMLTYAFLHADLFHLVFNALAIFIAALVCELLVGRVRTIAAFILGALAGGLTDALAGEPGVVTIGASAGALALLTAAMLVTEKARDTEDRLRVRMALAVVALPALFPVLAGTRAHVGGHLAGAAIGILAGAAMVRPPFRRWSVQAAVGICIGAALVTVWGAASVVSTFTETMRAAEAESVRMPRDTLEGLRSADIETLTAALEQWGEDPRLHAFLAHSAVGEQRMEDAIGHATDAIDLVVGSTLGGDADLEASIRVLRLTARLQVESMDAAEADRAALCGPLAATRGGEWARENGLCEGIPDDRE